jgi:hypothetical protein
VSINIHKDSRDRGLEILLYRPEKKTESLSEENKGFHLNLRLPFIQKEIYLNLEVLLKDKSKNTESP